MDKKEVIHMQGVTNALLNTILVSIPEEAFIVIMTLVFLKRFDMLDIRMWKHSLKWVMVPTIPVAMVINVFRYIIIIPKPTMSLIAFILMNVLILYVVIKNSYSIDKKLIFKTIIFTVLSFIIVGLIELLYYPLSLSLLHKEMSFFDNKIIYNIIISLPARIIEICILTFVVIKKNNTVQVNLFNTIVKNRFFTNSFLTIIISIVSLIIYIAKLIIVDNIIIHISIVDQLILTSIVISAPIILITWFLMFINYLLTKEKQIQQTYESLVMQDDIMLDVED